MRVLNKAAHLTLLCPTRSIIGMVKCASVLCFLVVLGAAQQVGAQETAQEIGQRHLREADSQSPEGRALRERLDCEHAIARATESTMQVVQNGVPQKDWRFSQKSWTDAAQPRCMPFFTPANLQLMRQVAAAYQAQEELTRQAQCSQAKALFDEAVRAADVPEQIQDQSAAYTKNGRATAVRVELERFVSSACPPDQQEALRRKIEEVVARKDAEVQAAIAQVEEAERRQAAAQEAAQKAKRRKAAPKNSTERRPQFEGQATSVRISGTATQPLKAKCGEAPVPSWYDGSLTPVRQFLRENANDPDSIKFVGCEPPTLTPTCWESKCQFRAKNAFGALVLETKTFFMNATTVLKIK